MFIQTTSPCPRPILKRGPTTPQSIETPKVDQLLSIEPSVLSPSVKFHPRDSLNQFHKAHSPLAYDRSPIVVSPNTCSLPERGCPGRTYLPGESPRHRSHRTPSSSSQNGKCLHPRAVPPSPSSQYTNSAYPYEDAEDDDNDLTPKATPTVYSRPLPQAAYPPALIPDISSSSDESDGYHYNASDVSLPGMLSMYS
ncbi:hypothetical protein NLI96_g11509 [Meripilus lineatus]|uniref:Uncharacterized protein n=1 Tax=Meripilus lineatus TaxID=2056292 RepID=A0AAD5UVQ9_9APHY|nr:hypothetical protein NLI96_g11509 [Physisporinus lineatus]